MMKKHILLTLAMLLYSSVFISGAACDEIIKIDDLIKYSLKYDGQVVCSIGILSIGLENDHLMSPEKFSSDGKYAGNMLWVEFFDPPITEESIRRDKNRKQYWSHLAGQCILIKGTFDKDNTGHRGTSSAAIAYIQNIETASDELCNKKIR